jgi:hypothetical protein
VQEQREPVHSCFLGVDIGIADQLRDMIALEGKSKEEATKQIWYLILDAIKLTVGWLTSSVFA